MDKEVYGESVWGEASRQGYLKKQSQLVALTAKMISGILLAC